MQHWYIAPFRSLSGTDANIQLYSPETLIAINNGNKFKQLNATLIIIIKETTIKQTLVRMFLARSAYVRVLRDSSKLKLAGLMCAIITVLQLPLSASFSSRVSLLSR